MAWGNYSQQAYERTLAEEKAKNDAGNQKFTDTLSALRGLIGQQFGPEYQGTTNADGTLKTQYKLSAPETNSLQQSGLDNINKLSQIAWGSDPTDVAQNQLAYQDKQLENNLDKANQSSAGSVASNWGRMAMRGGVSDASRVAMMNNAQNNLMDTNQNLRSESDTTKTNILAQDAQNKMNLRTSTAEQLLNQGNTQQQLAYDTNKFNIGASISDLTNKNNSAQNSFNKMAELWGANRQATAQENTDTGMCFITTAVCSTLGLADDNIILNTFRKFRDNYMSKFANGRRDIKKYYEIAPEIVKAINKNKLAYESIFLNYLTPCLDAINKGFKSKAYRLYKRMVFDLEKQYILNGGN